MSRIEYNVRKGNEYLQCIVSAPGETDIEKMIPKFSIYRYDAAPIPRKEIAKQIILALMKKGDAPWSVIRFNKDTLDKKTVLEVKAI